MSEPLSPCPWCPNGGEPEVYRPMQVAATHRFHVRCKACGAMGPYTETDGREAAIAGWNRRAEPMLSDAVVDQLITHEPAMTLTAKAGRTHTTPEQWTAMIVTKTERGMRWMTDGFASLAEARAAVRKAMLGETDTTRADPVVEKTPGESPAETLGKLRAAARKALETLDRSGLGLSAAAFDELRAAVAEG